MSRSSWIALGAVVAAIAAGLAALALTRTGNHRSAGRDPALWPFSVTSPWNEPIGAGAEYASTADPRTINLQGSSGAINSASYSAPVYQASESDPLAQVATGGQTVSYRIPRSASPAKGLDATMLVINPAKTAVDECWKMVREGPATWTCGYHARVSLRGSGVFVTGIRASGASELGGLIRVQEWRQMDIPHALAISLTGTALRSGWVWPAQSQDVGPPTPYSGDIPMGSLLAIPPDVNLTQLHLNPPSLAVATALQHYGGYVVDEASDFALYAQPGSDSATVAEASSGIATIRPLLRLVTNNGPSKVGGGGKRIVALAPALS